MKAVANKSYNIIEQNPRSKHELQMNYKEHLGLWHWRINLQFERDISQHVCKQ